MVISISMIINGNIIGIIFFIVSILMSVMYEKMLIFSIFLACHYLLQFEKCNFTVPNRNRGVVMVAVVQY